MEASITVTKPCFNNKVADDLILAKWNVRQLQNATGVEWHLKTQ